MCGRMNVTDHPGIQELMDDLGIPYLPKPKLNIAPGNYAEFVIDTGEDRELVNGMWSYLIEEKPKGEGFRPHHRYTTFNAQSRKLEDSRLWHDAYLNHRCIVPVSGFHEWNHGVCYNVTPANKQAIALGGLYKINYFNEQPVPSFCVITLPPQPQFEHIHKKSFPLILTPDQFDQWLDPDNKQIEMFDPLLEAGIPYRIEVTPVVSPDNLNAIGEGEVIEAS